jgi:hypothetical protein
MSILTCATKPKKNKVIIRLETTYKCKSDQNPTFLKGEGSKSNHWKKAKPL